jgi:hypothetical protein
MNLVGSADLNEALQARMRVCRGNKECCVLGTHSTASYTIKMFTVSFLYLEDV